MPGPKGGGLEGMFAPVPEQEVVWRPRLGTPPSHLLAAIGCATAGLRTSAPPGPAVASRSSIVQLEKG